MTITLVAGDFMQTEEFKQLADGLRAKGHNTNTFLAGGQKPEFSNEELEQAVVGSDFVLLAVSNSFDESLLAGRRALQNDIPLGIYAGSQPGCYLGENLKPLRRGCRLLFVFNGEEVAPAQELFINAIVVASGSPNWEKFFFPEMSRGEARAELGITEVETMILVPGDKDLILNILLFAQVIEATGTLARLLWQPARVIIGLHPGDLNPISTYADLARFVPDNVSVTFIRREQPAEVPSDLDFRVIPTPRILPGTDIMVTFVSTMGYEAACQRIPVVCFFPVYGEIWLEREAGIKPDDWEQCKNGSAVKFSGGSSKDLGTTLYYIAMQGRGSQLLKRRQEEVYPAPPEQGSAINVIVKALENFRR